MPKKLTAEEFVQTYKDAAIQASQAKGILPVCILVQAMHESGYGQYVFGNNFFGIKAGKLWAGKKQLLKTWEMLPTKDAKFPEIISIEPVISRGRQMFKYTIRDYFRAYDTAAEGFMDYCDFILKNKRYAKALAVKEDPAKYMAEIARAGYATDTDYQAKLISLYKRIKDLI